MSEAIFTLTGEAIEAAVRTRLNAGKDRLGDRVANLGASRVGYCARATVLDTLGPEEEAPLSTAGRWLSGKVLENEVVQITRLSLGNRIRSTGKAQEELLHPSAPIICHPDGRVLGPFQGPDGRIYEGDGALEIKTSGAAPFKKYRENGLPLWYLDQVTIQMGLTDSKWGLIVLANTECLGELTWWIFEFDETRFQVLTERGRWIQACRENGTVPAGETNRGWCKYCRHRKTCAEYVGTSNLAEFGSGDSLPKATQLELEMLGEELGQIQDKKAPLEQREKEIKEEARALLEPLGMKKGSLSSVEFEFRGGGEGVELDKKALEKGAPDIFAKYLKPKITKPAFYFTPKSA